MSRTHVRRLAVLALVALLATPALHAAGTRPLGPDMGGGILLEGWNLLQGVWGWVVGEKGGPEIDPDGRTGAPATECNIERDGQCLTLTNQTDGGAEIDPDGKP